MTALSDALSRGRNNFDLLRLIAALAVIFGHSYVLQWPAGQRDPVATFIGRESCGSLAVFAFFLLSGMLISASYDRQRSAPRFIALRIARIWPALAICTVVTVGVVGPLFTTWPLHAYFASATTWSYVTHMLTIITGIGWTLPGVFEHNPFGADVNAAIWTIPLELKCYLLVLVGGLLGFVRSRGRMSVFCVVVLAAFAALLRVGPIVHGPLADVMVRQAGYWLFPVPYFVLGTLLYAWRDSVSLSGLVALVLVAAFLGLRDTVAAHALFYLAFTYGVLWLAITPALHRFAPKHDYSYGLYVYGFLFQQCLASLAPTLNHWAAFLIALPAIFACAFLSWHWIERPALRACRALIGRRPHVETRASAAELRALEPSPMARSADI